MSNLDDDAVVADLPSIEAPKLDRWEVRAHVYTRDYAAKASILTSLFSGSGKKAGAGAVHEAKRYVVRQNTETGKLEHYGVAVRIVAATEEFDVEATLSLPNIAANASLNNKDACVMIDVLGYAGPLGQLLPTPKQLDVSTCAEYLSAFANIQAQVFGIEGVAFMSPTLIGYEVDDRQGRTPRRMRFSFESLCRLGGADPRR